MKVSFEGIGETVVTFYNDGDNPAAPGDALKIAKSGTVEPCADGDRFIGFAVAADKSFAAVQIEGCVKAAYDGTVPALGCTKLAAAGGGAVKASDMGAECLVVEQDTVSSTITFIL